MRYSVDMGQRLAALVALARARQVQRVGGDLLEKDACCGAWEGPP